MGGSLRGLGTKSARVGLDKNAYIEIIAPDPKNSGPIGAALARDLEEGTLLPYHYAIRSSEVTEMKDDYVPNELGWQPDHISMDTKSEAVYPSTLTGGNAITLLLQFQKLVL